MKHRHGITMIYDRWNHSKAPPKKPPLLSYNILYIIRSLNTNFLSIVPKKRSKIKTQRNGITCMQLTSPTDAVFLKQYTDQLRPLPRSSSRAVIYAFSIKQTQIPVHQSYYDLHLYKCQQNTWLFVYFRFTALSQGSEVMHIYWVLITINITAIITN